MRQKSASFPIGGASLTGLIALALFPHADVAASQASKPQEGFLQADQGPGPLLQWNPALIGGTFAGALGVLGSFASAIGR